MVSPSTHNPVGTKACHMRQHAAKLLQQYRKYACSHSSSRKVTSRVASASSAASSGSREGPLLDASIGPGLQLMEQQFDVAGHLLRMVAPADVDAVMDMYISKGIDGDPYWCRVWPSAISLAQQLLQRPELVKGKKVADLGAGLGVAGIAAALAGAAEVVLLDREPLALQCGLVSAAVSGVKGVQGFESVQLQQGLSSSSGCETENVSSSSSSNSRSSVGGMAGEQQTADSTAAAAAAANLLQLTEMYLQHRLQQQQQQQGIEVAGASLEAHGSSSRRRSWHPLQVPNQQQQQHKTDNHASIFRAQTFDWSSTDTTDRYDVILACDVLYEDTAVEPVASVIRRLLKRKAGSMLLLADPPNRTAANRQRFCELLSTANSNDVTLLLEESGVYQCDVNQLDPEMTGGVTTQTMPVQFMAFRAAVGNDTIGLKL